MKFYELVRGQYELEGMIENENEGEWVTRADAEQAAKDALEMAQMVQALANDNELEQQAQAIIERYEGGKG